MLTRLTMLLAVYMLNSAFAGATPSQAGPEYGSLRWHADQAKAKGQTSVTISTITRNIGTAGGFEDALDYFTVVEAVAVSSSVDVGQFNITTWHRFKVVDILSRASKCPAPCEELPAPPPGSLPLARNEILIPVVGGTAVIDGVVVNEVSNGPLFEANHKYLLFLRTNSNDAGVAILPAGASAAYALDVEGNIRRLSKKNSKLDDEVTSHPNLDVLRAHIREHNSVSPR